ncbi:unnamed protein product [Adineta ricciae]|uniref:Uncharacterized protein n=1 Tax=Adineta ricciae TaxID=249248 RepID=A0A816E0R5_ADIRI|nr:unnamed protein product [Adineta ricciae]CAF1640693.1 unnamed protein product [Adineta ricciae]
MFSTKHICLYLAILSTLWKENQSIHESRITLSNTNVRFSPGNYPGQILSTFIDENNLLMSCAKICNQNTLCRIFDINGVLPNQCRIFQGDINLHGTIISSSINNSQVGVIQFSNDLYAAYGHPCSSTLPEDRYLVCGGNFTWTCPQNTYWNPTILMCSAQSPILGSTCQQNLSMCRADLTFTCLQFNQCGPLSLSMGTTIASTTTQIANSSTTGLNYPYSIIVNKTTDNSIIVANSGRGQVIRLYDYNITTNNVSLVAQTWSGGNYLGLPFGVAIDPNQRSNLYVSDYNKHCVIKFTNMQVTTPMPSVVAGICGTSGTGTNALNTPGEIVIDSNGTLYIADSNNNRILKWKPGNPNGTIIAGSNVAGSNSFSLYTPRGIFLDENNSYIYVSDSNNHRIQRFSLFGGYPNNGTTVAGGNGQGTSNNKLNTPFAVYVSTKIKALYIADSGNHRIQRWSQGAQSGVTMIGDPSGSSGNSATMLSSPYGIALNDDETFLYIADTGNHRIQRVQLI